MSGRKQSKQVKPPIISRRTVLKAGVLGLGAVLLNPFATGKFFHRIQAFAQEATQHSKGSHRQIVNGKVVPEGVTYFKDPKVSADYGVMGRYSKLVEYKQLVIELYPNLTILQCFMTKGLDKISLLILSNTNTLNTDLNILHMLKEEGKEVFTNPAFTLTQKSKTVKLFFTDSNYTKLYNLDIIGATKDDDYGKITSIPLRNIIQAEGGQLINPTLASNSDQIYLTADNFKYIYIFDITTGEIRRRNIKSILKDQNTQLKNPNLLFKDGTLFMVADNFNSIVAIKGSNVRRIPLQSAIDFEGKSLTEPRFFNTLFSAWFGISTADWENMHVFDVKYGYAAIIAEDKKSDDLGMGIGEENGSAITPKK